MSTTPVKFTGEGNFTGEHNGGNRFYFRAANATTYGTLTVFGEDDSNNRMHGETLSSSSGEGKIEDLAVRAEDFDSITLAKMSRTGGTGAISIYSNTGTQATGGIHVHAQPSDGDTLEIGLTGFTDTITFKTTVASSGQVKIGADVDETADNLASYLNDSSTGTSTPVDGTDWNASAANSYLSATVTGSNVTVTDLIKCARKLGWVVTASNTSSITVNVNPIAGGIDGLYVGDIASGEDSASTGATGVEFSSPDITATTYDAYTFPPILTGASDGVHVKGKFGLNIRLGDTPDAQVACKIQMSNDNSNWWDATTTITDLNSDPEQFIQGDDLFAEYARLNIMTNSATNQVRADVVFVYAG